VLLGRKHFSSWWSCVFFQSGKEEEMWELKKSNVYKMKLGKQIKTQLHFPLKKNTAPPPQKNKE
jgi:hypothetical protein